MNIFVGYLVSHFTFINPLHIYDENFSRAVLITAGPSVEVSIICLSAQDCHLTHTKKIINKNSIFSLQLTQLVV